MEMLSTEESIHPESISSPSPFNTSHFSWIISPIVVAGFIISVIGSTFIFFLVCISKTFRRSSNYLIANLCVASVYHIIVSILYNLQSGEVELWTYGPMSCYIAAFIHRLSTPVLPLTIAAISLDRSVVARNPLDYPSRSTAIAKIAFIWIFSSILLIPRACMTAYDNTISGAFKCKKVLLWDSIFLHTAYAVCTLTVIYLIPSYILVKEFFAMRCQMKFLTMSQVEQRKRFHRRIRVMKNACIFTCIFITCWLPQGLFQFPFDLPENYITSLEFLQSIVGIRNFFRQLSIFNTCVNPILLLVLSFDIREFLSSCYV